MHVSREWEFRTKSCRGKAISFRMLFVNISYCVVTTKSACSCLWWVEGPMWYQSFQEGWLKWVPSHWHILILSQPRGFCLDEGQNESSLLWSGLSIRYGSTRKTRKDKILSKRRKKQKRCFPPRKTCRDTFRHFGKRTNLVPRICFLSLVFALGFFSINGSACNI